MKIKKSILVLAILIVAIVALIRILMWNSSGGFFDFVAGQFEPSPKLTDRGVSRKNGAAGTVRLTVSVDDAKVVAEVEPEYLSFAIDTSQLVGGKWWKPKADVIEMAGGETHSPVFDFNRPRLDLLVKALRPAYLRIGGTEADKTYYDLKAAGMARVAPPPGYGSAMSRAQWDGVNAFAKRNGLKFVMTLNTGPSSRRPDGSWDSRNSAELLAYTARKGYKVDVWELGNELNLLWYDSGPSHAVKMEQYRKDLLEAKALIQRYSPGARFTGHSSAFWPVIGEPLTFFFGMMKDYIRQCGDVVDTIGWHYYPQQGRRGPIAVRKAYPSRMLDPGNLDEAAHWAGYIGGLRDRYAPGKDIWLGETGNAQFGGEPGVSDAYIGGLWWLDQLGILAKSGVRVVVRQTLAGMNYGMIDEQSLVPNPDFWNSLLWKRLMGSRVYAAKPEGDGAKMIRVYAHGAAPGSGGALTVLVINLHHDKTAAVEFPAMKGRDFEVYSMSTPDVLGREVMVNGGRLALGGNGEVPRIEGRRVSAAGGPPKLELHPLSYAFVVFHR
jgi:heparanase 1